MSNTKTTIAGRGARTQNHCEGHETTDGPIGSTVYCDGSCIKPYWDGAEKVDIPLRPNAGNCAICGEHRDALCDDGRCWNCSPLGAQREPREVEPTFTARAAFGAAQ